jgi:hypothetical protein
MDGPVSRYRSLLPAGNVKLVKENSTVSKLRRHLLTILNQALWNYNFAELRGTL